MGELRVRVLERRPIRGAGETSTFEQPDSRKMLQLADMLLLHCWVAMITVEHVGEVSHTSPPSASPLMSWLAEGGHVWLTSPTCSTVIIATQQ